MGLNPSMFAALNIKGHVWCKKVQDTSIDTQAFIVFLIKLFRIYIGECFNMYLENLNVCKNLMVKELLRR